MTSLRTQWGCDLQNIARQFGADYQAELIKKSYRFQEQGMMINEEATLYLTRRGKLFADSIASDLFL